MTTALVVSGITIPASLPIADTASFVRQCFSHESNAFNGANSAARADSLKLLLIGIAVAGAAHNDSSKVKRMGDYAITLPNYKVSKSGTVAGSIGKILAHASNAASIGKSLYLAGAESVDVDFLLSLPSWSGLVNAAFPAPVARQEVIKLQNKDTSVEDAEKAQAEEKAMNDRMQAEAKARTEAEAKAQAEAEAYAASPEGIAEAEAKAQAEAEAEAKAQAEAKQAAHDTMVKANDTEANRAIALCELASHFGIVLTKAQLAKLDKAQSIAA